VPGEERTRCGEDQRGERQGERLALHCLALSGIFAMFAEEHDRVNCAARLNRRLAARHGALSLA
jgi:hypothetical protein